MKLPSILNHNNRGFTLIEVLIGIAILSALIGLGLFLSMDFYRTFTSQADKSMFISILQKARTQSLSNINQREHGVKLVGGNFILFQGPSYDGRDASFDEIFPANPAMAVVWPAPSEVVFGRLSGNVDASFLIGDIIITSHGRTATISFNTEGRIDY